MCRCYLCTRHYLLLIAHIHLWTKNQLKADGDETKATLDLIPLSCDPGKSLSIVLSSIPQKSYVTATEKVCPVYVNTFPELWSPDLTKAINSSSVSCYRWSQGIQRLVIAQPYQISLYLKMLYPFIAHFNSVVIATKNRWKEPKSKVNTHLKE